MTPTGHRVRVEQLLELQRYAEAEQLLGSLLAEDPNDADLLGLSARCHLGLDRPQAALMAADRMVAVAPEVEWGHRLRCLALDELGRHDEAVEAAATAVRLAPHHWQTHQTYALAAVDARGRLRDARAAAERAVALAPNEPGTHFAMGVVAQARGEDEVARAAYRRTLALEPNHAMALNNLTVLDGTRRLARAAHGFGASLRHAPQDQLVRENVDNLAAVFVRRIYIAGVVALIVGLAVALPGYEDRGGELTPWSIAVGIALLISVVGYTVLLARRVPVGIRRYAASRLRSDGFLIATLLLTIAMVVVALVTCLVPYGAAVGLVALRPLGLLNVALVVWTVVRRHR